MNLKKPVAKVEGSDGQRLPTPDHAPRLFVIGTPIGNLEDLTPRARRIIFECDELWCEDTRETQNLLRALTPSESIRFPKMKRMDHHSSLETIRNEMTRVLQLSMSKTSKEGQKIGVLTDAGMPGLSDPGGRLIQVAREFPEFEVVPIPGVSALTTLISVAGFEQAEFQFRGFAPRNSDHLIQLIQQGDEVQIYFESPHRIVDTLQQLAKQTSEAWSVVIAKELTKKFEKILFFASLKELQDILHQEDKMSPFWKGEWCFVISKNDKKSRNFNEEKVVFPEPARLALFCLIEAGIPLKRAAELVHHHFSVAKNLAYDVALKIKNKS